MFLYLNLHLDKSAKISSRRKSTLIHPQNFRITPKSCQSVKISSQLVIIRESAKLNSLKFREILSKKIPENKFQ